MNGGLKVGHMDAGAVYIHEEDDGCGMACREKMTVAC